MNQGLGADIQRLVKIERWAVCYPKGSDPEDKRNEYLRVQVVMPDQKPRANPRGYEKRVFGEMVQEFNTDLLLESSLTRPGWYWAGFDQDGFGLRLVSAQFVSEILAPEAPPLRLAQ